jgi:hypothetical protein
MKHGFKHIAVFFFFLLTCSFINGQVSIRATADKDKILIGEPVTISVDAYVPPGARVSWFPPDSIPHFEVMNRTPVDTASHIDGKKVYQVLTITSFDSGRWQLPAFQVLVEGRPYYSDSLTIDVAFASFDPKEDYRDIKEIIEVASPSLSIMPWILGAVSVISLLIIFLLLRKRKYASPPVKEVSAGLSAYDEAMQALAQLRKNGIAEGGEKGYYSAMNDILRRYLARQFTISTFERTNEELIIQLSGLNIPKESFIILAQSLRMSDFVKFAKYRPSEEDNKSNLDTVRSFIEILENNIPSAV